MEQGADQVNLKRPPLCGKLQIHKKHKQNPPLSPSGLVVLSNPGYAQVTHITSAGVVFSSFCAIVALARSSSPDIALNPPRVGSEVEAGFHPRRPFAHFQVESRYCLFLVVHLLLGS